MKKLIFVFAALFLLVLISGCNARNNKTVRFDGDQANVTSDEATDSPDENSEAENEAETPVKNEVKAPTGKLEVISFDGAFLKTKSAFNVVRGGASSDTHKITINDYKLQKYYPGQIEWSYIAARNFSTLNPGWNNYVVKTFDKNGKQIDSLIFSIDFDAPPVPENLPNVGSSLWLVLFFTLLGTLNLFIFRKLKWL